MPTINQLIRKPRRRRIKQIKATALHKNFNAKTRKMSDTPNPQKRGVCVMVKTMTPKKTELGFAESGQS